MSEAWFGFLGVIVGAAVSLLGERFTTRRERDARQALRDQQRKDVRDAFQRDAIISLQDAVRDYWGLVVDAHTQIHGPERAKPSGETLETVVVRMRVAYAPLTASRAEVFDDPLRRLVKEFDLQTAPATGLDPQQAREAMKTCYQRLVEIEDRVNALVRDLF